MSVDVDQWRESTEGVHAATWQRAVEAAVHFLADDYEIDPDVVLAQESFISRLDGTVDLDPDVDADLFGERVEEALAAHAAESFQPEHAPAGSPTGGQFTVGGGGGSTTPAKGGKSAPKRKSAPVKKKPAGPLGFDGKTGSGYGTPGGDPQVHEWQRLINVLGVKDAQGKPLRDDGQFGPRTTAATRALQQQLGLPADGKVTPELLARVKVLAAAKAPKKTTPKPAPAKAKARVKESLEQIQRADRIEGRVLEEVGTDAAGGRVFRVRIIREGTSRNRKRYTESVLRRAVHLYEGAKAYSRHRTPAELVSSTLDGLVGGYRNVAYESGSDGGGLYGDLHLLPSAVHTAEALDASIAAQAQGLPPLVGISHDVVAAFRAAAPSRGGHVQEAVAITRVHSADVVADPSAGGQVTRVLAGGIEDYEEAAVPLTAEDIDAIAAAVHERQQESVTESTELELERVTEAGDPKNSIPVKVFIRQKLTDAGMSALYDTIVARLPERVTEAHVDAEISAYKAMLGDVERAGLRPTVTSEVVRESRDKQVERLDKFFSSDFVGGYHSLRHAYMDITGYRPSFDYDEDVNRRILRESFGGGFDSGSRTTESVNTSTWAQVLGDSVTRRVVAAYRTPSLQSWRRVVSSIVPVEDFRTQRVGRVGGYGTLPTVTEGSPYQPLTTPPDEEATYALAKKGGMEDVTLEQIANDDRRVIPKIPGKLGRAAAQTLYRFVFDFFTANPATTYDAVTWFHASHNNTTAAALSQSAVSAASVALMTQTAYGDASEVLGEPASLLVVPAALRELAFQICRSSVAVPSTPAGPSNTPNIHSQQDNLDFIVVPYFTDVNDWFAIADPQSVPTLEVGFYNGRQEPEIFTQADNSVGSVFNADVFTWKIRFIFSGTILDHRGVQRGTQ